MSKTIKPNTIDTFGVDPVQLMAHLSQEVESYTKKTAASRGLLPRYVNYVVLKCKTINERLGTIGYANGDDIGIDFIALTTFMNHEPQEWVKNTKLYYCTHPDNGKLAYWYSEGFREHGVPIAESVKDFKFHIDSPEEE